MSELLFYYEKVHPVSWAYLSSLLLIGLFFKFNRFWSVRNLDLILLILLAPGLLLVNSGLKQAADAAQQIAALQKVPVDPATGESAAGAAPAAGGSAAAGDAEPSAADAAEPPDAAAEDELADEPVADEPVADEPVAGSVAGQAEPTPAAAAPSVEVPPQKAAPGADLAALQKTRADSVRMAFQGYLWLFVVCALLLVRLLFDPTMVRRPLLEPNLTNGGLLFIGISLFVFLMANVVTSNVTARDLQGAKGAAAILDRTDHSRSAEPVEDYSQFGPGHFALHLLPRVITTPFANGRSADPQLTSEIIVAKTMAILAHLAVVVAMVLIGYLHFENIKMGIGAATMYLMLPYTAQMTGHVYHVLPAALLLWAIVLYRRPAAAGVLIGLAMSVFYYPFFLLPLWLSFYWQRGVMRFTTGLVAAIGLMVLTLVFVSGDVNSFVQKVIPMFGFWWPKTAPEQLQGIWGLGWEPVYRLPVIVSCGVIAVSLAIWPAQKNLGTLLSCTAAVMIAVQFWHAHGDGGGMYMAWFLPLTLLTVFRPNLEDRVALSVLGEDWFTRRRARLAQLQRAA
jgi:hypothetical protein